ncbi:MAG: ATP-binding protein [Candidatus Heimdallarchaeota archaeon]
MSQPQSDLEHENEAIGALISASTEGGLCIKLRVPSEQIHIGQPMIVEGQTYKFYCLIERLEYPPDPQVTNLANSPFREQFLPMDTVDAALPRRQAIASLTPLAIIPQEGAEESLEADTIPPYHCPVRPATREDLRIVYRETETSRSAGHLPGFPDFEVPIDLKELVSLPFGTFGKTGAGKTIFELVLAGNILHAGVAQLVVIDPHGSFGYRSRTPDRTPGLKFFFPEQVTVIALDPGRMKDADYRLIMDANELRVADLIMMMQDLSEPMIRALYTIDDVRNREKGVSLISAVLDASDDFLKAHDIHKGVFRGLRDRLAHLRRFAFVQEQASKKSQEVFLNDLPGLLKAGQSLVFSLGEYAEDLSARLLLANVLGRRLDRWYRADEDNSLPRLVFILEEAHLFLSGEIAQYTVFGKLIRESRKFRIVLAIVDQMPDEIPQKILSQVSTRFVLRLEDVDDIRAAIARKVDPKQWYPILRRMPKRQVFAVGDAVAVPTIFTVQEYREDLMAQKWGVNTAGRDAVAHLSSDQIANALRGEKSN